jgi:hypothetical protein
MKKIMILVLCIIALGAMALAQAGNAYIPDTDVLGAHNNGGRGCAGCHAPHSGAAGNGGNAITGQTVGDSVDNALFGQDLGPLYGKTFTFGKGATVTFGSSLTEANAEEFRTIGMCLACHDGSVAQGAMMTTQVYEQRVGMLPTNTYGGNNIPSVLGKDGYANDHPVGPVKARASDASMQYYYDITLSADGKSIAKIAPKTQAVKNFVANYGMPALEGSKWSWGLNPPENGVATDSYVACTTCHNQHLMNVYVAPGKNNAVVDKTSGATIYPAYAEGTATGQFKTYFFINAPYNPSAMNMSGQTTYTKAPTTSQFCRQCHFGEANEAYSAQIPTAW